jgi:hypothetical protein
MRLLKKRFQRRGAGKSMLRLLWIVSAEVRGKNGLLEYWNMGVLGFKYITPLLISPVTPQSLIGRD